MVNFHRTCCETTIAEYHQDTCENYRAPVGFEWGEPPPTHNERESVHDLVIKDIEGRKDFGRKKYGTFLQAYNGRDSLKDAYEEALDLCCYLRQALEERERGERDRAGHREEAP